MVPEPRIYVDAVWAVGVVPPAGCERRPRFSYSSRRRAGVVLGLAGGNDPSGSTPVFVRGGRGFYTWRRANE